MILISLLEVVSDATSNWIKPRHVLALNKMAIRENIAWILNWAIQYTTKAMLVSRISGKANPKNARIQK